MSTRKEPTQSIRIRQSDYDILIGIMDQEGLKTITEAISWSIHAAAIMSNRE
jgi:hypothetical protein|tara:strand:- start:48 stop:203 length:156 start_codon:yes stop_codon:yes gene_type:complete